MSLQGRSEVDVETFGSDAGRARNRGLPGLLGQAASVREDWAACSADSCCRADSSSKYSALFAQDKEGRARASSAREKTPDAIRRQDVSERAPPQG